MICKNTIICICFGIRQADSSASSLIKHLIDSPPKQLGGNPYFTPTNPPETMNLQQVSTFIHAPSVILIQHHFVKLPNGWLTTTFTRTKQEKKTGIISTPTSPDATEMTAAPHLDCHVTAEVPRADGLGKVLL